MNVEGLQELIAERDEEFKRLDSWSETTVLGLLLDNENEPVKLFNGGSLIVFETLDNFSVDYSGNRDYGNGWDSASGKEAIIEYTPPAGNLAAPSYFKVEGYFDSWDNGDPEIWKSDKIVKVEKEVTTVWKEVE